MNSKDQNIFKIRIRLARKMAGMSLQELSDSLENKVTKQSLNKYEQGLMKPTIEVLIALSKVLGVKPDYFLKQELVELGKISFRKKARLSKRDEDSVVEKTRDYAERFLELESILGLVQKFENPLRNLKIKDKSDVEKAAYRLRKSWGLGTSPIQNLVEMLELRGIKVLLIDDVEDIDGFATFSTKGIPIVVVNIRDKPIERIRFTTIHELAHILLNFEEDLRSDEKTIEKLCHYFSSCFLIPRNMLLNMIGGLNRAYIDIKELISIKEYYGISIRAILHRLMELGVITQTYYRRWMIYMNNTYGSRGEPGRYIGEEGIKVFERLINRALSEGLISFSKAAVLSNSSISEIRKGHISVS